ncbi:MAG: hypothetical protein OEM81_14120 [Acidimicrobiia bacterium]|nr:hypothetical protein [Acidimicrobiia bacterium]MDH3398948.1 hypothetical protein [Acidimicrobiia bacterium]
MKKFVFLYYGYAEPTQETMDAWMAWFGTVGEHLVDSGNPFGPGREVTTGTTNELTAEASPITGYSIVNADSMDDAEKLLAGCPIIDSVRIYEATSM